jgi:hypothetical protein
MKLTQGLVRRSLASPVAFALAGCMEDAKVPLAPERVISAETSLDASCSSRGYKPSRAEVRGRRLDVRILIRAVRRDPDTRYRFDDSDTDPQTLRQTLAADLRSMRRVGACSSYSHMIAMALHSLPRR